MNYTILEAWASEFHSSGLKVENVFSTGELIRLRFKNKQDLILALGTHDSFPFWTNGFTPAEDEAAIFSQLAHASLSSVSIAENDRVIRFSFEQTDIYQERQHYVLIAEFTPPKPNAVLAVQNEELVIVDALHKYTLADNPQRQVLPRLPYQPAQTSFKPLKQELALPLSVTAAKSGETIVCPSVNDYLENYYYQVLLASSVRDDSQSLRAAWERLLKKAAQKLAKQQHELADAAKAEYWLQCAETLKHNLGNIRKGQAALSATNYFDPQLGTVEIPLQADKSPQQNLQFYWKKYHKAKRGAEIIRQNVEETEAAISNLQNIIARIDRGEFSEYPGSKNLASLGRKLDQADKLLRLRLSEEFEIVIGRKARENDFITTQLGQAHDWWFHTRIYHGSHILLRCFKKTSPGPELVNACCSLAAWYSKARWSVNVPVDYTQIRFVRKPRRSAPGLVTYTSHSTVFANPKDLRTVREELLP